ncbi:quinone oxidoreductase-like protein 1 isoform X1 [Ptychodera flava]|uniref:quinone oxidoreductase-like protein 1 isoform X1 n=2 Tax=Ptychodera flava TaxID=63121 RepID=UPI00396A683C
MRTVCVQASSQTGDTLCILEQNAAPPSLADNSSVMIQVKACGLAPFRLETSKDLNIHKGSYPFGREISGTVIQVGSAVTSVKVGDEVVGMLPLDADCSGCADICVVNEYNIIVKPTRLTFTEAAACIGDGVRAYTALQYLARLSAGETLLVTDAANSAGQILIQLAQLWGAKVIATAATQEEKLLLERMKPELAHVIDMSVKGKNILLNSCLEETGGLGVDIIIDNGVKLYPAEEDDNTSASPARKKSAENQHPSKHELVMSLAVGGRWVTSQHNLQLDPPESQVLFYKAASLSFLFYSFWTLSSGQQGRYLHILKDIVNKVANGTLKPNISKTVTLEEVCDLYPVLNQPLTGKIVMTN